MGTETTFPAKPGPVVSRKAPESNKKKIAPAAKTNAHAVVEQPGGKGGHPVSAGWSTNPDLDYPVGLECLAETDSVIIKQQIELLEACLGCETNNKYEMTDKLGHLLFFAKEDTFCLIRICLRENRPFVMGILDPLERTIMEFKRPFRCCSWRWSPCCLQRLLVRSPTRKTIGSVQQECNCLRPKFHVMNSRDDHELTIFGPLCVFKLCGDVNFPVYDLNGGEVGKVSKHWGGLVREGLTDADTFTVHYPKDMNAKNKATLLGAALLIDFLYFEDNTPPSTEILM